MPEPFGWDCGRSFVGFSLQSGPGAPPACAEIEQGRPEIIGEPGSRGSGEGLNKQQLTDSGLLVGSAYRGKLKPVLEGRRSEAGRLCVPLHAARFHGRFADRRRDLTPSVMVHEKEINHGNGK